MVVGVTAKPALWACCITVIRPALRVAPRYAAPQRPGQANTHNCYATRDATACYGVLCAREFGAPLMVPDLLNPPETGKNLTRVAARDGGSAALSERRSAAGGFELMNDQETTPTPSPVLRRCAARLRPSAGERMTAAEPSPRPAAGAEPGRIREMPMPQMVGEWRTDPDPVRRAIYWLIDRSWTDADDFEQCQQAAHAIWPLRTRP